MQPYRRQPTRLPRPWDSPGKNTGLGCHFLLQGMKMKSESEVAQSCPTLSNPMDCSLPSSSVHGIFQARILEWGAIAFCEVYAYITVNPKMTGAYLKRTRRRVHCKKLKLDRSHAYSVQLQIVKVYRYVNDSALNNWCLDIREITNISNSEIRDISSILIFQSHKFRQHEKEPVHKIRIKPWFNVDRARKRVQSSFVQKVQTLTC